MKRAQYEVACSCCVQGYGSTLRVSYFSDHNNIGSLSEDVRQTVMKGGRINPDFPLVYITCLMLMQVLYRILYRDYIALSPCINYVYKCR